MFEHFAEVVTIHAPGEVFARDAFESPLFAVGSYSDSENKNEIGEAGLFKLCAAFVGQGETREFTTQQLKPRSVSSSTVEGLPFWRFFAVEDWSVYRAEDVCKSKVKTAEGRISRAFKFSSFWLVAPLSDGRKAFFCVTECDAWKMLNNPLGMRSAILDSVSVEVDSFGNISWSYKG